MNAPQSSETRSPLSLAALVVVLVALGVMAFRTIATTDYWMHLASARAISEHGVGTVDTLSTVSAGKAWHKSTWLYDVLVGKLHGLGGGGFVTLLHLASLVGAFAVVGRVARAWAGANAVAAATLLCAWMLASRLDARPEVFILILPALLLSRLEAHRGGWALLAWALPIQVLWANLHPSFILAPLMALAYAVEALIEGKTDPAARARMVPLFAAAGGLLLIPILHPAFAGVYGGAIAWLGEEIPVAARLWSTPYLSPYIELFIAKAPGLLGNPVNWVLGLGALGLVVYKKRLPLARTALAILGALLVVGSFDNAAELFALLVLPFLTLSLQSLGNVASEMAGGPSGKKTPLAPAFSILLLVAATGTILSFLTNGYYVKKGMPASFGLGAKADLVPAEAMEVINRPDFPAQFINLPLDGGYIAWKGKAGTRVLLDQRLALHGPAAYKDLMDALLGRSEEAAKRLLQDAKPAAAVINCGAYQAVEVAARLMSSGSWAPAYLDGATLILVARSKETEALLADTALQARGLALIEKERQAYAQSLGGLVAAPLPSRLIGAAGMLLARGQTKEALALYHLLQAGAPTMVHAWIQKGVCLLRLDKRELAVTTLKKATEMTPKNAEAWAWLGQAYDAVGKKVESKDAIERAKALTPKSDKKADEAKEKKPA